MNKKIIFSTYCHDEYQERFGINKLVNSFKHFHPDHEIIVYGSKDIDRVYKEYGVNLSNALPCLMLDIKRKYNADFICHIDADSLCLSKLDEILNCDYEIASVRNNCDLHTGDERQNRPKCLWELPNEKYVNCGCISTNSEDFLLKWIKLNNDITLKYGDIRRFWGTNQNWFWMCDQNWMNYLFHYGNYSSKISDPKGGNLFYGASANMYKGGKWEYIQTNEDPEHIIKEYGKNGWQSWKEIEYKDRKFWLYGKQVKLLHMAGGGNSETTKKLSFDMFNLNMIEKLKEITKYNE